jgi:hypothetical protein
MEQASILEAARSRRRSYLENHAEGEAMKGRHVYLTALAIALLLSGTALLVPGAAPTAYADDLDDAIRVIRTVVSGGNSICRVLQCEWSRSTASQAITYAGRATTIYSLGEAAWFSVQLGDDLRDLNDATRRHGRQSAQAREAAQRACFTNREVHQALVNSVTGLSLLLPVPDSSICTGRGGGGGAW